MVMIIYFTLDAVYKVKPLFIILKKYFNFCLILCPVQPWGYINPRYCDR